MGNPDFSLEKLQSGDQAVLARAISIVENRLEGSTALLEQLKPHFDVPVVGFTGAPGAGKSSLVNALATYWIDQGMKIGIIAVDPASPFNLGSLLGDRVRMSGLFNHPNVFIRSISTRGSLGGLSASIIEITDLFRNAGFDRIIIETVGVGQSEVEIAGVADITVVVTVPEGGDDVQALKSGVMEIADIFVVNKSDREGAGTLVRNLRELGQSRHEEPIPVIETVATIGKGTEKLADAILTCRHRNAHRRFLLLADKLEMLVIRERMQDFNKEAIAKELEVEMNKPGFNLYLYSKRFTKT